MSTAGPRRDDEFDSLFLRERAFVARCLRHLGVSVGDVDDFTQEVFLVVHRHLGDRTSGETGRAWLFAIARRVAANYRRSERRRSARLELIPPTASSVPDGEARDAVLRVEAFLGSIKQELALVFVLIEVEGMTGAEVGAALDVNVNTIHARLRAARKLLARFFAEADMRQHAAQRRGVP